MRWSCQRRKMTLTLGIMLRWNSIVCGIIRMEMQMSFGNKNSTGIWFDGVQVHTHILLMRWILFLCSCVSYHICDHVAQSLTRNQSTDVDFVVLAFIALWEFCTWKTTYCLRGIAHGKFKGIFQTRSGLHTRAVNICGGLRLSVTHTWRCSTHFILVTNS